MERPNISVIRKALAVLVGATMICGFTGCASNFATPGKKYSVVVTRQHNQSVGEASYPLSVGIAKNIANDGENRYIFLNTTTVVGAPSFVKFAAGKEKTRFTITPDAKKHSGSTLMFVLREPKSNEVAGAGTVAVRKSDGTKGLGSPISVGNH